MVSGPAQGSKRWPVVSTGWCHSAHHDSCATETDRKHLTGASSPSHRAVMALSEPWSIPMDCWFWAATLAELKRNPPATLKELQTTVPRGLLPGPRRCEARGAASPAEGRHLCPKERRHKKICERRPGAINLFINRGAGSVP